MSNIQFFTKDIEGLSTNAQALALDAQQHGGRVMIGLYFPESDVNHETTSALGSFDADTLIAVAVKSVEMELSNAKEWLEALPQIQTMILKKLEDLGRLSHHITGDIAIPNMIEGDIERGLAVIAWVNRQGDFISYSDGIYFEQKLFIPKNYSDPEAPPSIVDDAPVEGVEWEDILTGEPIPAYFFESPVS